MGAVRTLGLGAVTAMVAAGLSVATAPTTYAADPVLPAPDSASWLPLKKSGAAMTDASNDFTTGHLNLTPSGGTLANATVFAAANLEYAFFRFHVAEEPAAGAAGAYIVQFDTDNSTAGWERAIRFDPVAKTVAIYTADANSAPKTAGTLSTTLPVAASGSAVYPGTDGGGFVAFAVPRGKLSTAGINLGAPMVTGASSEDGAALNTGGLLGLGATGDILGVGKNANSWSAAASDPLDIDSDGDGIIDRLDNCPVAVNPGQEDDDAAIDNSLPPGTTGVPDGTEGRGNACDTTPRGYDLDGDAVGLLDDQCPEQYGALSNGCVAQSTTNAVLRYKPRAKLFKGTVRADFDQCVPRRSVTVFRSVTGPDKQMGKTVKTDSGGSYAVSLTKRAPKGKYYASVDPKWTLGARCFAVKSPKIEVR